MVVESLGRETVVEFVCDKGSLEACHGVVPSPYSPGFLPAGLLDFKYTPKTLHTMSEAVSFSQVTVVRSVWVTNSISYLRHSLPVPALLDPDDHHKQ